MIPLNGGTIIHGHAVKAMLNADGQVAFAAACLLFVCASQVVRAEADRQATDSHSVESFFDEFFNRQMHELDIPGAVVVWVRDGVVRHAESYGVANRETTARVDFDKTVFRIASVSKFFTALCALQLAEERKLELDEDVNQYLGDMHVGTAKFGPITASRLIVHTGGFDERLLGYLARDPLQVADLSAYLQTWMPPQTRTAGQIATYSNHGYALLGHLVERQSGMRFDAFARQHVFEPLDMAKTAFLVPPFAEHLESNLCPGYWASGEVVEPIWSRPYPAGALATTGADMGRFLVAFLAAARGQPSDTFPPSVIARLTQQHFSHRPEIPGYTLGLAEMKLRSQRVLLKGGSAPGHSAVLAFVPELDAGLFVAVNRQEPQLWTRLLVELAKREFPETTQPALMPPDPRPLNRFVGEYRAIRYANASFERVLSLAMHIQVQCIEGKLLVTGPDIYFQCQPTAEPLVFSSESGRYLAFEEDDQGRIEKMYLNVFGEHLAAERLSFFQRADMVGISFLTSCVVLVCTGLFTMLTTLWRRIRFGKLRPATGAVAQLVSVALAASIVATMVTTYLAFVPLTNFLYGPSAVIWMMLTGTNLTALLAVTMLWIAGKQLLDRRLRPIQRGANLVVCVSCVVLPVFLIAFNLVGYRL